MIHSDYECNNHNMIMTNTRPESALTIYTMNTTTLMNIISVYPQMEEMPHTDESTSLALANGPSRKGLQLQNE